MDWRAKALVLAQFAGFAHSLGFFSVAEFEVGVQVADGSFLRFAI